MRAAAREQRRPQVKTDTTVMKSVSLELAGDAGVPNLQSWSLYTQRKAAVPVVPAPPYCSRNELRNPPTRRAPNATATMTTGAGS